MAGAYWLMMFCNVVSPQLFWFRKLRRNIAFTFFMSIIVNMGMWFERFVIIVTSVYRDYLPSAGVLITVRLFGRLVFTWEHLDCSLPAIFLFAKYFPVIAVAEIKHVLKTSGESFKEKDG